MKVRALTLAVQGVLVAMYAMPALADDEQVAKLIMPTNYIEAGVLYTPQTSAKFGEYTGINKDGGYLNGNFDIRGGDAYGNANGTRRWDFYGTDLGLSSRTVGATLSNQGLWSIGVNYDELTHYGSGTFQTPYQGTNGGNVFTLPGFGAVANTRTLNATQLGQFHQLDLSSTRDNTTLNGTYVLNRQWDFKFDFNHLDQSGAKLQSVASSTFAGSGGGGQKISLLPMPTNSRTETATAAFNWVGEKAHATIAYYGSFYRDNFNGFKFDTWSTSPAVLQTFGTPPSNNYQKISVDGGYAFSPRTKLAGGLSYAYNTQDAAYNYDITSVMVNNSPTASLNGSVANIHADVKLTDQTTKDLTLSAGAKYDDRDNRTTSNIYSSRAIDGGNIYNYPNTPLSIKRTAAEIAADYRVDPKQKLRFAFNYDETQRECDSYAVGGGGPGLPVTAPPYAPGTNCVTAVKTKDPKLSATYRLKASDDLNFNVGYGYSARRTTFDTNARTAMINTNFTFVPLTSGQNAGDYNGFHPYFESSRNQNMLKAGANWQATDKLSFTAAGRYTYDDYMNLYGIQTGTSWSVDLDSTYNFAEKGAVTLYLTQQQRTRKVTLAQDPTTANATRLPVAQYSTWTNDLRDTDSTIGLNVKQGGLMGGKFDLAGDLTYSLGRSDYDTLLNYQVTTTGNPPVGCSDPSILSCGSLPEIRNAMIQFKLNGTYQLEKNAKLSLGYVYRNLQSTDFYYNGYAFGMTPTGVLPTGQQAPSYHVNMVLASFIYTFK